MSGSVGSPPHAQLCGVMQLDAVIAEIFRYLIHRSDL